jgi:hypothetical protein
MKWLKSYQQYKESIVIDLQYQSIEDLTESLNIWHDVLLNAISAEEMNIFDVFSLPKEDYKDKMDLDYLEDNIEFINSLSSIGLKKSTVQNTDDSQTFVNKPCKFMFIYNSESNELENPVYIVFQVFNDTLDKWDDAKLYKINEDVNKFYNKLSSKTVEITDGDVNYIYQTSNGSDWDLQNIEKENDIYKKTFRKEELQQLFSDRNVKVSII